MNAAGLPIPTMPATPAQANADTATPLVANGSQAPTDFVLALAQMLGTAIPQSQAQSAQAALQAEEELDLTDATDAAASLLALPMLPTQLPEAQKLAQGDPLEMLGLTSRPEAASARDAAILQALTERLAGIDDAGAADGMPTSSSFALDSASRATTTEPLAHSRPLQHHVGTQAWADELGSRLTLMTDKGQHTASIRLSPEHLGPLEIRIAMRDDQASVWFGAAHADTRAAIEHALPRLRELFAEQGMSLADAGVSREPPQQTPTELNTTSGRGNDSGVADETASPIRMHVGLLDAYA